MGVNSLPKTVTRQRRGCDLNPGPSAPESSTLTTRLPSHPSANSARILLGSNTVCRHVYCTVYIDVFGALAVIKHFRSREQAPKTAPPSGRHGPAWVHNPNGTSITSSVSLQPTVFSFHTSQWTGHVLPKLSTPWGVCGPKLIHGSFAPHPGVHNPKGISIGSAVSVKLTVVANRQTHRQTTLYL